MNRVYRTHNGACSHLPHQTPEEIEIIWLCEQVITVLSKWQVISQQKIYKCLNCLHLFQFISQFPTQSSETLQNWIFNPIATPGFILCVQRFEMRGIIIPSVYIIGINTV